MNAMTELNNGDVLTIAGRAYNSRLRRQACARTDARICFYCR